MSAHYRGRATVGRAKVSTSVCRQCSNRACFQARGHHSALGVSYMYEWKHKLDLEEHGHQEVPNAWVLLKEA